MSCLLFSGALMSIVAMTFATSDRAQAQTSPQTCSVHTLHGSYVFATHGWNIVNGVAVPKAIVEGIDFNGDGTLNSPFSTLCLNGVIIRSTNSVGTYTLAADCTGTVTFTAGPSFDIFVGRQAREISMIQTGPVPAVFEGLAKKVSK
jgi:hypothetical protein